MALSNRLILGILVCTAIGSSAQIPSLLVTPSKVTMVAGESHLFRAVGADGRIIRGVHWAVSPVYSADLHAGDEAEVSANAPKQFEVVADYEGRQATALVTVIEGYTLPQGTVKWSVTELPGFKTAKLIPAVPSLDGPDIYAQEVSPTATIIRAYTDDGRELWRTALSGKITPEALAQQAPILANKKSACDAIKIGSNKNDVAGLPQAADYSVNPPLFKRDEWLIEEPGVACHVYFDSSGRVAKKRRELTNE